MSNPRLTNAPLPYNNHHNNNDGMMIHLIVSIIIPTPFHDGNNLRGGFVNVLLMLFLTCYYYTILNHVSQMSIYFWMRKDLLINRH